MALSDFKPTIWSAALQGHLDKALVAGSLVSTQYEGELTYGNSIVINKVGAVSVSDYNPDATTISPAAVTTTGQTLALDVAKYFAIKVDDADAAQARASVLDEATRRGAYAFADAIDGELLSTMIDGRDGGNDVGSGASPYYVNVTGQSAYSLLVELSAKLTEAKVPMTGRFAVVTPAFAAKLVLDERLNRASVAGDSIAVTGMVGEAAGFRVLVSHNQTANLVLAGHEVSTAFVQQVNKVEAYRDPATFSDVIRALVVCGFKVIEPSALAAGIWGMD
ncbi:hypothetical protein UFOVP1476_47 [uncultured Caudovirales phage]|uniref:Major capsid protein Gp5 n=1 Tax=uncultured Caudovirales phage TaxID=2100421 RepID=A0A6J5SMT1_9CAUD|nr:hypothetical protein UFOVP944_52 [uncultured Caudovirales phage]CAB4203283.1 hypothetical protein UFOVP1381_21 [uncultured Caudovirales phage]CAB4216122.1 hypothetical protein UFOVP1476_47 [uncultured Caudovirales phage]